MVMVSILWGCPCRIAAQSLNYPNSPKDVLRDYRKLDAEGERLTASGWNKASVYFVRPAPPPRYNVMAVLKEERFKYFVMVSGEKKAEVVVDCLAMGQIDSSARFTSTVYPPLIDHLGRPTREPSAPPLMYGQAPLQRQYILVLTDTHWEFGPKGEGPREVKGQQEWRIETFEFEPWVTIDAAIRYLTKLRTESSSQLIKKNADTSIATLRRLRRTPAFQTTK